MRTHYLLAIFLLTGALLVMSAGSGAAQSQAGGGSLPRDASGGAALIFHKPDDPPIH